jgi:hypothetical protein
LSRAERWLFHASNALVVATGGIYAWMLYALEPQDEYALVNHPWQPALQHMHVWFAPFLVLMAGVLWRAHAAPHLRSGRSTRRRSGIALLALLLPMVMSGYSIQVVTEPAWRTTWIVLHVATSCLWLVSTTVHLLVPLAAKLNATKPNATKRDAETPQKIELSRESKAADSIYVRS